MLPAAVPQHPQPAAAAPIPRAPRAPGSKKNLIVAGAIGAVVIGGGLAAFLLLKGGEPSGGASSPEELAKAAARAISEGDIDAYLELGGMADLSGILSCHFADDNMTGDYKETAKLAAKRYMGVKLKVESVGPIEDDDDERKVQKAGARVFDSCKLTQDVENRKFTVRMEDGSAVEKTVMRAMKVGDRWYFNTFDDIPKSEKWDDDDDEDMLKVYKEHDKKRKEKIRSSAGGSAESAAKALFDAVKWGSHTRASAITIARYGEELEELFTCEGYSSELHSKLEETDSQISRMTRPDDMPDFDDDEGGSPKKPKKAPELELKGVEVTDQGKIAKGDDVYGCTAKQSMERAELEVKVTVDGDSETLTGTAVKIDDSWRILYFKD